jgi:type IV pilus assembly protein PilB
MPKGKINLNKILLDSKEITSEELDRALEIQKKTGKRLQEVLISEGFLGEDDLISIISYYLGIPFLDPAKFEIDPEIKKLIPEDLVRKYTILPLYKAGDILLMAVAEPLDIFTMDNLRISVGCEIKQVLSREKSILSYIDIYYSQVQSLPGILGYQEPQEVLKPKRTEDTESMDLILESQQEPVVQAVNLIINEAIAKRASDIHLEPTEEDLTIRYRIDGILRRVYSLPKKIQRGIIARIKILSNLDITKFYLPQDGRFFIATQGKQIDFRVSSLPTIFGEKFVLRILDKAGSITRLDDLGVSEQPLALLNEAIAKEHGMILITGPTGSGKSTTLNAILNRLNIIQRHIVTIEDPVEYQVEGIGQTQVKPEIELTFATALRGILRQSPDIIMIGEIRDTETADIAIKASLIGQLIFSTLHTNDSVSAFARLIDMGVERYLVAYSLILICAQRLCRRICPHCKEPLQSVPEYVLQDLGQGANKNPKFYHGRGCSECYNTGYKGRIAIMEALKVDDYIKGMVIKGVSFEQIKELVIKEKRLITLRDDGLHKAVTGVTTIEEVYRVTAKD